MGLTVYPPSRTLEPLAFDEYCRFDTSPFFWGRSEARFIPQKKAEVLVSKRQYSSKANSSNVRDSRNLSFPIDWISDYQI
jgi:hypothetical protein